jgi:hypothetical protein
MSRFAKLAALALVVSASALSLGASPASAALCDGTWRTVGTQMMQCYYLPTVTNGRVSGLSLHRNFAPLGGPVVVPPPKGPHHHWK